MLKSFIFLLIFSTLSLASNEGKIRGKIIDQLTKQPLIGASVLVVGTNNGASTDADGNFFIAKVPENVYQLQVSYIGYNPTVRNDIRVIRKKTTNVTIGLEESILQTEEVVITAGSFEENTNAPVSNFTYTLEEIKKNPGGGADVFRAISSLPGVSSGGAEFSAFAVRGGSPKENVILVDNIPFDKVTHLSGGNEEEEAQGGRFSIFASELIDEANFQGGGFSARYGGKNASYIKLKIKEGNKDNFTLSGYYDLLGGGIDYSGPTYINKNTSLIVSARHLNFDKVLEITGQDDLGHTGFTDLIVKSTTQVDRNNKVSFLGIWAPEYFERTKEHIFKSDTKAETQLQDLETDKSLLGLNWQILTSKNSFLQNTFYHIREKIDYEQGKLFLNQEKTEEVTRLPKFQTLNRQTEIGYKADFVYHPNKKSDLNLGLEIKRLSVDYSYTMLEPSGVDTLFTFDQNDFRTDPTKKFLLTTPESYNQDFDAAKMIYSSYTEYSHTLFKKLTLTPGIRFDYSELNEKAYFSPRFSATYSINQSTKLNLATGIYYQNPELNVVISSPSNTDLKNEKAIHYIFGITKYFARDFKFTAEAYYKDFDDLVVQPTRTSAERINSGSGFSKGIDLGVVKQLTNGYYGQVNYSYSQSKRNDNLANDSQGSYNSDFNQPHIFNILVGYNINKNWSVSARWKYATGRPKDDYIKHENIFNDPNNLQYSKEIVSNNSKRLEDYHSLNVRVDHRWQLNRFAIVSFLDILNLYNHKNVSEERFLERTGEIEEQGFGIIPTLGMKIEF